MTRIFSVIHGQCTVAMIQKLKSNNEYMIAQQSSAPNELLKLIRKICNNYQSEQLPVLAAIWELKKLFTMTQGMKESNIDYFERFKDRPTIVSACGANLLFLGILVHTALEMKQIKFEHITNAGDQVSITTAAQEIIKATLYLENANPDQYGNLMKDLENNFLKLANNYPRDIIGAKNLLLNYKGTETTQVTPK